MTLGASSHWLGTRRGLGGTSKLAQSFFFFFERSPWLDGQLFTRFILCYYVNFFVLFLVMVNIEYHLSVLDSIKRYAKYNDYKYILFDIMFDNF